jgi:phosphoribosylformimino-5-aminoimidazole carboxamide ribotide isomerase
MPTRPNAEQAPRFLILPAIDIRGGLCVRLRQGDYAQETIFGSDPAAMARHWMSQGATYLHLVDLDGAREGRPINGACVQAVVTAAGIPCQLGGGLRTEPDIAEVLNWGVQRIVIGTRALKDPAWFQEVCNRFPGKIILGIDARHGRVATDGWLQDSERLTLELARHFQTLPLAALVYTDIDRDGMLEGPNFEALAELKNAVDLPVIASGGISTLKDIRGLAQLGLAGCIVGRALYENKINLREAIQAIGP